MSALEVKLPAIQRISRMRTLLILDHPFFGALSLRLKLVNDPSKTKDMATDGRAIYFSEKYVDGLEDDELLGMLAHLVMHPAMQHHTRRGHRDDKKWQKACDLAINQPLVDAGFKLPLNLPLDPRHTGKSAESIYSVLLEEDPPPPAGSGPGEGKGGDGQGNGNGEGQGEGGGQGDGDGQGNAPGQVLDAPDPAQDASEWQIAVKQAANAAQMMGNMPADMKRLVQEANRPHFDFRSLLMRFAQDQSKNDFSFKMPNRRYMPQGFFLPSAQDVEMGQIDIGIDSSGSITDKILAKFLGTVQEVVDQVRPRRVRIFVSDARVHRVHIFERDEEIEGVELVGGGGTDFRPVFKAIEESDEDDRPACILYLTDGYGSFPDKVDVPTLWCMTTDVEAPVGETIRLEVDEIDS
jgi:predicted metal-dependent peptidase